MPLLTIVNREGTATTVEGEAGLSLMEVIRDAGFEEELLAICGGCLSCATCHIHVGDGYADRLPAMTDDEDALLDASEQRTAASRLSCQIEFGPALDGLSVTIAAEG